MSCAINCTNGVLGYDNSFRWQRLPLALCTNAAGWFDSRFSRGANTAVAGVTCVYTPPSFSPVTELWVHFSAFIGTGNPYTLCRVYDSATGTIRTSIETVTGSGMNALQLGYWTGSSLTYVKTPTIYPTAGSLVDIDLHIKVAPTGGVVELYSNGTLVAGYSGNTSGIAAAFSKVEFLTQNGGNVSIGVSQVIIADGSTITPGMKLATLALTGAGGTSQWTGAYTNVSGTVINDANTISDSTNGDVSTYVIGALPSGPYQISAIGISLRGEVAAGGTQNIQSVVARGGTNYAGVNLPGLTTAFLPAQQLWTTDPSTGAQWTSAGVAATQIGVKAIA